MKISKISTIAVATILLALGGCAVIPTSQSGVQGNNVTLASATTRGAQFGPAASTILGSVMDVDGCGSIGKPVITGDPTVASSAEVRDQNGNVTYDLNASGSKVHKCR